MGSIYIIVVTEPEKAKRLIRKLSKNNVVVRAVAVAVELDDARVLGGFVSQYKAKIVKSLFIVPNLM